MEVWSSNSAFSTTPASNPPSTPIANLVGFFWGGSSSTFPAALACKHHRTTHNTHTRMHTCTCTHARTHTQSCRPSLHSLVSITYLHIKYVYPGCHGNGLVHGAVYAMGHCRMRPKYRGMLSRQLLHCLIRRTSELPVLFLDHCDHCDVVVLDSTLAVPSQSPWTQGINSSSPRPDLHRNIITQPLASCSG